MIESDIVADGVLLWLREELYQSFRSIRKVRHLFCFFSVTLASEGAAILAGSKIECVRAF